MSIDKFEVHQPVSESVKAIDALYAGVEKFLTEQVKLGLCSEDFKISKQQLKVVMSKGAVWLTDANTTNSKSGKTNRLRRTSKLLKPNQTIHLYYDAKVLNFDVPQAKLLLDKGDYSLWYKPKGMMSQGSKWSDHSTIVRFAQTQFTPERQGFIIHRLDRATDGVIVVGHTKSAASKLCDMFAKGVVNKRYLAIVHGEFPENLEIDLPVDNKAALSHCIKRNYCPEKDLSLVEVKIDTGRKHQIRRHLSAVGFTIVGDRLYGKKQQSVDLQLTSFSLEFICPLTNQPVSTILGQNLWPDLTKFKSG